MNDDESLLYERLYNYAHITRREHANNMPNFEKCIQKPRRICIKLDRCTPRYAKHWTSRTCMADGRHTTRFVPPSTAPAYECASDVRAYTRMYAVYHSAGEDESEGYFRAIIDFSVWRPDRAARTGSMH